MHANSTKDFLMTWTLLLLPAITMAMEAPDAGAEVLHGASEIHGAFVRMLDHDPVVTGSPATRSAPDTSSFEQMVNAAVRRGDESSGLRVAAARLPAPERASVPPGASEVNGAPLTGSGSSSWSTPPSTGAMRGPVCCGSRPRGCRPRDPR